MVAGKLEAKGRPSSRITFTLKEEKVEEIVDPSVETETPMPETENGLPVRLYGGRTPSEGRLQVNINAKWGTVCNYGWTIEAAALVCHQLGYVLNPNDWLLDHSEIPTTGTSDPILLRFLPLLYEFFKKTNHLIRKTFLNIPFLCLQQCTMYRRRP